MKKIIAGQLAVAFGVLAIGLFFFVGSFWIPDAAGYSTVGPKQVPRVVGAGLMLLSLLLAWEVWRGGFRQHDEDAEAALPMDWRAFAWLSAGLIVYGLTIERGGFIIASVLLFLATTRAFYSARWLLNLCVAILLSAIVFAIFKFGLGLNLPEGVLQGVL
jgi:putative tricarboxylic transport membrane protein